MIEDRAEESKGTKPVGLGDKRPKRRGLTAKESVVEKEKM